MRAGEGEVVVVFPPSVGGNGTSLRVTNEQLNNAVGYYPGKELVANGV